MWHELAVFEAFFKRLFTGVHGPGRDEEMDCSSRPSVSASGAAAPGIRRAPGAPIHFSP
jgi:hypothetical protein